MRTLSLLSLVVSLLALGLAEAPAQNNTLVRFRVSYGSTVLGNIDVELFDQEKPVTVSNFLAYVDSGRYKRTFLHRLIPGFVAQGGAGTIVNPYSQGLFNLVYEIDKYPPIANEFNVGPYRPNLFGTLAMAKITDQPDSATASWFFNMADNSTNRGSMVENLDTQNGGFTVFGRAISGTNLFTTLNSLSKVDAQGNAHGIINVSDFFSYGFYCGVIPNLISGGTNFVWQEGTDVPVSYYGNYCVRFSDLLVVDIFRLAGLPSDTVPPTVVLTTPVANTTLHSNSVFVSGTAADAVGVASVDVILNHERLTVAPGGTSWSTTVENVLPGTNTVTVLALDAAGNQSKPVFRNFFYLVQEPLHLNQYGLGTVTGKTNGQVLDLGRNYTLVAKPAPGYVFLEWTGSVSSASSTIAFTMKSNTVISAVFIPNPFIPTMGVYNGLFSSTNMLGHDNAGYFTMKLTDRGTYSGKLTLEGRTIPFKGIFNLDGTHSMVVPRKITNDLFLLMNLDFTNGTRQLNGRVSRISGTPQWIAPLVADLVTANAAPHVGSYTMIIPGTPGSSSEPQGDSYATIKVDAKGTVTVKGSFADNSKLVQKTTISKDGTWPFFTSLYKGSGLALGWLDFVTGNPDTDILGDVIWVKSPAAGGVYYPGGFLKTNDVVGSTYVKPATATNRIVNIPNGTVAFTGGNLPTDFSNGVAIAPNSSVTTTNTNKLTLTFAKASGMMKGVAAHPNLTPTVKFSGAVLQKQVRGSGFFLGTNQSGRVVLQTP